jgi:hypothetical protein
MIESRRNLGRESETYLHHLFTTQPNIQETYTVCCQGDTFDSMGHDEAFIWRLEKDSD